VPLTLSEAILGCNITIHTIDGKLNVAVPPGTGDGHEMILKNKGVYEFNPPENYDEELLRGNHILQF